MINEAIDKEEEKKYPQMRLNYYSNKFEVFLKKGIKLEFKSKKAFNDFFREKSIELVIY